MLLSALRVQYLSIFRQVQRGKDFEKLSYYDGYYLLSGDGTGFYSSEKVSLPNCMGNKSRNSKKTLHQQMYAACFVNPGSKVVIPVFQEMSTRNDGTHKNDYERITVNSFFDDFRLKLLDLNLLVVEDALSSNGPHVEQLKIHNLRFIL